MPYQVRAGSFLVVVSSPAEALRMFDEFNATSPEDVSLHDMDGAEINPGELRLAI